MILPDIFIFIGNMAKFLFIRFSSIGDIVLTTPLLRCLKKKMPEAKIHYITKKQFAPLLIANPYIDKLLVLETSLPLTIKKLEEESYDYVIDLHNNLRSFIIKRKLKKPAFSFCKLNIKKWLLVQFKINLLPQKHIVDRYMDTLRFFGVNNDYAGLDYSIPPEEEIDTTLLVQKPYLALVTGANHQTKQLTREKMLELCNRISYPVVLLGGEKEKAMGEYLQSKSRGEVLNFCGSLSINQSASLIRQASVVVTPDTGLMHIAAAYKKDIISVWGNTVPAFGMYPYLAGKRSLLMEINHLSCRPCSKLGFSRCPRKYFACINAIDMDVIVNHAHEILHSSFTNL